MEVLSNVFLGVIASLIAVVIFEVYLSVRQLVWRRKLKTVLSLKSNECAILAPLKPIRKTRVVSFRDAFTFGHIFNICSRLSKSPYIIPYTDIKYLSKVDDVISVGGPVTNSFCKEYLEEYLPGFKLLTAKEPVDSNVSFKYGDGEYAVGFRAGNKEFIADSLNDIGVLIKIPESLNKQGRTIHLIFGFRGHGSASASYYLWKHYKEIFRTIGGEKYCLLIESKFNQNYRSVKSTFINVTDSCFKGVKEA